MGDWCPADQLGMLVTVFLCAKTSCIRLQGWLNSGRGKILTEEQQTQRPSREKTLCALGEGQGLLFGGVLSVERGKGEAEVRAGRSGQGGA